MKLKADYPATTSVAQPLEVLCAALADLVTRVLTQSVACRWFTACMSCGRGHSQQLRATCA